MARGNGGCLDGTDVAVLAGGRGVRVRGVLKDTPKVLAPIAGRPYLSYLLDWLEGFGARRIVLCLGHLADAVLDYVKSAPPRRCDLIPVVEPVPLGTAGALRQAGAELRSDPVMVINGDSFVDADLCVFLDSHRASGAEASILCAEVDDPSRYGCVEISTDGRIRRFAEKNPLSTGVAPVSAGVYLLNTPLLDRIASGSNSSLEHDVFEALPAGTIHAMIGRFTFIDIGTPESLAKASEVLSRLNRLAVRSANQTTPSTGR